jgi:hypothetical protein
MKLQQATRRATTIAGSNVGLLVGILIAGRGHNAQRPDAGRSAKCETESRQHTSTGENDEDSTRRVVHIHSWVWIAARMVVLAPEQSSTG